MGKRNLTTLPHLTADVARLVDDFEKETDRGVALLGAAFLDDVLDVLLRAFFINDSDAVNKLCGTGRPLESFGARTHLAYCVGLLGRDMYHDINLVREIRNDFAHRHPASFEFPEIRTKCHKLKIVHCMMTDPHCTARDRYIATTVLLANHLMIAAESQPHSPLAKDFSETGILRLK